MAWITLIVGLITLFFAVFTIIKIPKNNFLKYYFVSFSLITSAWILVNVFVLIYEVFILYQLGYAMGALTTASGLVLYISFSMQKKLDKKYVALLYLSGIIFFVLCFIDGIFFLESQSLDNRPNYTSLFSLYAVYLFGSVIYLSTSMFICMKKFSGVQKNQARFIFIGITIFAAFSFIVSFLLPMLGNSDYIMLDASGFLFFVGFTFYAIVRYHLMEINFIIKKSTVYTLMVAFVTGVYIVSIFLFEVIFQRFIGYSSVMARVFAGLIIALTFLPFRKKIENLMDRVFYRDKAEYIRLLHDFSKSLIKILDLRKLMGAIVKNISNILKVDQVSLLFYDKIHKDYRLRAFEGFSNSIRKVKMTNMNPLILWLKNQKNNLIKGKLKKEKIENSEIITQMKKVNAELAIPLFFDKNLIGILFLGKKNDNDIYSLEDLNLLTSLGNQAAIAFSNALVYDDLKKLYIGTIEGFVKAIEAKDVYTKGHSERVVQIAVKIAIEMGISREEVELLQHAGLLHDIGKIGVDNKILHKKNKLSKMEYDEIKKHPVIGKTIVSSIKFLRETSTIILHHHERWDGKGYPNRYKEKQIPLLSRIICIADAYDSMTSDRPYRRAMLDKDAIEEIKRSAGTQFDPELVKYFLSAYEKSF